MTRLRPAEIAIVGMGCRFPGAVDLCAYFENIMAGKDCTREVPADRWDANVFHDPASTANDRVACREGGYLDEPIWFDAASNGIMPRTVEGGEPEQFLVLEATLAALADAGIAVADLAKKRVDIVIGRGNYFNRGNLTRLQHGRMVAQTVALLSALNPGWTESEKDRVREALKASLPPFEAATIPGQLTNATAGRVASRLNTSGASLVVDAASASSLVALDVAVRALAERRADVAITGGVYLEADVDFPLVFRQLSAASPTGVARPFSADADGMVSGEGAGIVVLMRKRDAERAGHRIYAIVRGVGIASDGRAQGLAAPSARGHARAIRRAYRHAKIDPATIGLIEGHGLGVPAADRAELRALKAIFPAPAYGRRALGAVSSMIGHAMPAAGIAGLIKTALALHHRVIPPTLHGETPHPCLSEPTSAFALNSRARPWALPEGDGPRRAGVNAFGFAGINAHAILEEHPASAEPGVSGALLNWESEAILLEAADRPRLVARIRSLIDWIGRGLPGSLKDVAFTLNHGRKPRGSGVRLGVVATSLADLSARLNSLLPKLEDPKCHTIRDGRGVYFWDQPLLTEGSGGIAFLFPGEGSQYPGMLADLCMHFPDVRQMFDIADRIALDLGEPVPPSERLWNSASEDGDGLWSTSTAVNVVLTSQRALHHLLTRLELVPDAVIGHSSGEILALAGAGVLRADRVLERQLGRLGEIFRGFETSGDLPEARLVAVAGQRDRVESICRELNASEVVVAIDNCPHQVVLAGPPAEVDRVVVRLRELNFQLETLPFDRAYHTDGFGAVLQPIADFFDQLEFRSPAVPVYSCATASRMPEDPAVIRSLAVAQWTRTVAFRDTIQNMHADGLRVFVDVGARGNLAGFVEDILRGKPAFSVAANLPRRGGLTQLNHLVAAVFAQGAAINPDYLYARRRPILIDWQADRPVARPRVQVKLGFPELRLPQELIDELRSRPLLADDASDTDIPFAAFGNRFETFEAESNDWAASPRIAADAWPDHLPESSPVDSAVVLFQDTMRDFLETQRTVMAACLGTGQYFDTDVPDSYVDWNGSVGSNGEPKSHYPDVANRASESAVATLERTLGETTCSSEFPGPWAGEVIRIEPVAEVETLLLLDGRDDPLAHHHTLGGRKASALDPSLMGLPVLPFAAMAEMTAQVAALVVTPGLVLNGLEQVKAHKWVRYEDSPVHLRMRGQRIDSDDRERVWVGIFNHGVSGHEEAPRPVFEAVAVYSPELTDPPLARPFQIDEPRTSKFTAESIYADGWLFHGPPLQALVHIGGFSEQGMDGTLRVLPWQPLLKAGQSPELHVDPIILDAFTHLLGCWGLDFFSEGDVIFPLRMEELEIHGERPPDGTDVECRIWVEAIERHRIRVSAEVVRPDGTVWMRISDWEDWRFHWPGRYRDVFRQPHEFVVGEPMELNRAASTGERAVSMVWLEPPADMGRPIWRDVLEQTQLGPEERAQFLAGAGSDRERSHHLWARIAAKEAARRIWLAHGHAPTYPADLAIVVGDQGRPLLSRVDRPRDRSLPAIATAYSGGVAVALACADPAAAVGIDVQSIDDGLDDGELSERERALLASCPDESRAEWLARLRSAKKAAMRAWHLEGMSQWGTIRVSAIDSESGVMHASRIARNEDECGGSLAVITGLRGRYAWAWTLLEEHAK